MFFHKQQQSVASNLRPKWTQPIHQTGVQVSGRKLPQLHDFFRLSTTIYADVLVGRGMWFVSVTGDIMAPGVGLGEIFIRHIMLNNYLVSAD